MGGVEYEGVTVLWVDVDGSDNSVSGAHGSVGYGGHDGSGVCDSGPGRYCEVMTKLCLWLLLGPVVGGLAVVWCVQMVSVGVAEAMLGMDAVWPWIELVWDVMGGLSQVSGGVG